MTSALATKRDDLITTISSIYRLETDDVVSPSEARSMALAALEGAERLARGAGAWRDAVTAFRGSLDNDPECERLRWALVQYNIYLVHASDHPNYVAPPVRELDPNSETYLSM